MTNSVRRIAAIILALLASASANPVAAQAAYPARPIRMVVPFPPGGPTDITARIIGAKLGDALGQPVVIDNKPGGHGFIGVEAVAKAPADGYTVLMASIGTIGINPVLYPKVPYDVFRDLAPVSLVVTVPIVLVTHPSVPVKTVAELVDYARKNPEKLAYASAGSGGSSHLVAEMFKSATGTQILHVPYKGSGPAVQDLVGGQVQLMFDTLLTSSAQIKAGRVRLIATATAKRLSAYPDTPTIAESGLQGFDGSSWYCLLAPAGTPPQIVTQLSREVARVLGDAATREKIIEQGAVPVGSTPAEFAAFIRAEQEKWGRVVRDAQVKPD
jgi:tripartite-type tricarboxylate transporter receptor subunit TctC